MADPLGIIGALITMPDGTKSRVVGVSQRPNEPDVMDVSIEIQPVPIRFTTHSFTLFPAKVKTRMLSGPQHVEFERAVFHDTNPCEEITFEKVRVLDTIDVAEDEAATIPAGEPIDVE